MQDYRANITAAQRAYGTEARHVEFPFNSIAELLLTRGRDQADDVFLIFNDEDGLRSELTYAEFHERCACTAAYMRELGLNPGDRIATAAHNHSDTIVQYFAAWALGLCVVPLNMGEDDARLQYILENSGARVLFCRQDYLERVPHFRPAGSGLHVVPVYDQRREEDDFHFHVDRLEALEFMPTYDLDTEALIVYTSGTTGKPKGVVLVQRNLMSDAQAIAEWHGIDADTRMMCVLPVHHVNGTIVTHVTPMFAGGSVVLNRKFSSSRFFRTIRVEGVNIVSVVPTLLAFLLETDTEAAGIHEAGFRHIICGAGPLTCELARRFETRFNIRIIHGYGLSESTCYSSFMPLDLSDAEFNTWRDDYGFPSIGLALPNNEMAIHDAEGNSLPERERGEIVIRGSNIMKEYYNNPEANADTFKHQWFRSGDEGFFKLDDAGRAFYFITGRLKELIIRGGVNLAPLEIDEVLSAAPGVRAGICVGFDNDFYGEEVGALVIPENDNVNAESIIQYCAGRLPFSKQPKVVLFSDELPVTSTGKYQRTRVRHLFNEWKAQQFKA